VFTHILFPTDGSALSRKALAVALGLAKPLGARITAIHVMAPYAPPLADIAFTYPEPVSPENYEKAAKKASAAIRVEVEAEARKAGVECDAMSSFSNDPWDAIVDAVSERRCDVVVMASHGRRGLAAALIGSEAQKVVTHSPVPVLVCR
jgi:nucleotide-binding universal stress UspA family protein